MSNDWCDSIRRCSSSVRKKKKITPSCVQDSHHVLSALWSGLSDATATQFPHFPNLIREWSQMSVAHCWMRRPWSGSERREEAAPEISRLPFSCLVVEKKVTADKHSGTVRCLPHSWAQMSADVPNKTTQRNMSRSDVCVRNLSWLCRGTGLKSVC